MKIGGRIPWNAIPICETFKISCRMGRLHMNDVLDNLFKGPIIPSGSLVEYYPISARDFKLSSSLSDLMTRLFLFFL